MSQNIKILKKPQWLDVNVHAGILIQLLWKEGGAKRKRTNITAIYVNIISSIGVQFCEEVGRGVIKITDISDTGMMIEFNSEHNFTTKDRLIVEFNLNDKKRTLIKKEVAIKNISGLKAGVAFCTKDSCDAAIKNYLEY